MRRLKRLFFARFSISLGHVSLLLFHSFRQAPLRSSLFSPLRYAILSARLLQQMLASGCATPDAVYRQ